MNNFKVYSQFDEPPFVPTSSGDKFKTEHLLCHYENGEPYLKELDTKTDIQKMIQANAPRTTVSELYNRAILGDEKCLEQNRHKVLNTPGEVFDARKRDLTEVVSEAFKARDELSKAKINAIKQKDITPVQGSPDGTAGTTVDVPAE